MNSSIITAVVVAPLREIPASRYSMRESKVRTPPALLILMWGLTLAFISFISAIDAPVGAYPVDVFT